MIPSTLDNNFHRKVVGMDAAKNMLKETMHAYIAELFEDYAPPMTQPDIHEMYGGLGDQQRATASGNTTYPSAPTAPIPAGVQQYPLDTPGDRQD